jgi:Na+/H+ antiporter NhaD/arsenite permease-like protein
MSGVVLAVFVAVYLGMFLGGLPGLRVDRTGIALLGGIALIVAGALTPENAVAAIHPPTLTLLLAVMLVSGHLQISGFYARVARRIATASLAPPALLGLLCAVSGAMSAVLVNDVVCLAMAPILVEGCSQRRLDPVPFLLALAASSNVGSAATLIGNPQNMLVGQALGLSFGRYALDAMVPAVLGLVVVWAVVTVLYRGRWARETAAEPVASPPFLAGQTAKGILLLTGLVAVFLLTPWRRDVSALAVAGILLVSRRTPSRVLLGLADWPLLILFAGLFVVNHALLDSGWIRAALDALAARGLALEEPATLFGVTAVLSNIVSNVPAVMLLLPAASHPDAGAILALSSTLAGNLLLVGSIANLIVVEQAGRLGIRIGWRAHARVGIPVTVLTLALAAAWLAVT